MKSLPYNPHDAHVTEEQTYRILNSSQGIRNYIPKEDLFSMMIKVFSEISKNLTCHCGPYSKSALVVSPSGGKYETNTFTKDGRNIIASMNFVSPIEEIIKEMLLYIGSRVDNKAGDGTTSSMYIAARFFNIIAEKFKDVTINTREFSQNYKKFEKIILNGLQEEKITINSLIEAVYGKDKNISIEEYQTIVAFIAAFQTLSSSGGDIELAKAMYEIYLQSPEGTWDYVSTYHQKYENTKKYEVASDLYDYFVDATILNNALLNENLYSEYKSQCCDLLVLPESIPDAGIAADSLANLLLQIGNDVRENKPLIIVCRSIGAVLLNIINAHNNKNTNFSIVVFENLNSMMVTGVSMDLIGLSLSGGTSPYISSQSKSMIMEHHIIHNVSVHYKNHKLYVNNLFEKENNSAIHPFYKDPEKFIPYTSFLTDLKTRSDRLKNDINQIQYKDEVDDIQNLIGKLCFPRRPYLMIGGASHDHAEAIDVVRDVCGAINSSLTNGFICGSSLSLFRILFNTDSYSLNKYESVLYLALYRTVIELIDITSTGYLNEKSNDFLSDIGGCNTYIFNNVLSTDGENRPSVISNITNIGDLMDLFSDKKMKYSYINYLDTSENISDSICKYKIHDILNDISELLKSEDKHQYMDNFFNKTYPIIQPSMVFEQLLYRIGELMIKLITTECVIVPGAVYVNK